MLAPPLLDLEQTVDRLLAQQPIEQETVSSRLANARSFLLESGRLFKEVDDTLLVDKEGAQKLRLCAEEMAHCLSALDKLELAATQRKMLVLRERLDAFLLSHKRCLEFFAEFSQQAMSQPIYSPVPAYDTFIKTGLNVLDGRLKKERIEERFPAIVPELQKVQRLVGLLPRLHQPPAELMQMLQKALQGLESGYGAMHLYLDQDDEQALDDGLKLIGSSSVDLQELLAKAEVFAASTTLHTKFRPLEEWLRLRTYLEANPQEAANIPDSWIFETVSSVFRVWDFMLEQARKLLQDPMLVGVEVEGGLTAELNEEAVNSRLKAEQELAALELDAFTKSDLALWTVHIPTLDAMSAAIERSYQALEERLQPFKELPGLELVVQLKEQTKRGLIGKGPLHAELTRQLNKVEHLIDSVRDAEDPVSIEFNELLPLHRAAFVGMLENLESEDWDALDARWEGIVDTLPHLANLSKGVRAQLSKETSASKQVRCMRCEAMNAPERRMCSSCGATLPTIVQQMQTFTEITEEVPDAGGGGSFSPRAIDLLESLVRGFEAGRTTKRDAGDALQLMINDLNRQRQMFTKKLVPLMGRDQTLDAYLRFFAQTLATYFAGLMEMHEAVKQGNFPRLQAGLSSCRETLEVMDAVKERIDEAMRG